MSLIRLAAARVLHLTRLSFAIEARTRSGEPCTYTWAYYRFQRAENTKCAFPSRSVVNTQRQKRRRHFSKFLGDIKQPCNSQNIHESRYELQRVTYSEGRSHITPVPLQINGGALSLRGKIAMRLLLTLRARDYQYHISDFTSCSQTCK